MCFPRELPGRKAENPSDAAGASTATAETAGQTFYEKPKGKTEETWNLRKGVFWKIVGFPPQLIL